MIEEKNYVVAIQKAPGEEIVIHFVDAISYEEALLKVIRFTYREPGTGVEEEEGFDKWITEWVGDCKTSKEIIDRVFQSEVCISVEEVFHN